MACHRAEITSFLEHVWLFYIEAASQIKKRLPLDDEVLKSLTFLDPNAFYLTSINEVICVASKFRNIIDKNDLRKLDDE